jgi:hypothetical protein
LIKILSFYMHKNKCWVHIILWNRILVCAQSFCRKLISYPGIVQAAGSSFKKTSTAPKGDLCPPPPPPPWLSQNCCHAVVFLLPLKHNRHDTFLACCNCHPDKTRGSLDDTVVNCCQRIATRLFFMFAFGCEHYSDDSHNTFVAVTTI